LFHTPEYIEYLEKISHKASKYFKKNKAYQIGDNPDCPIFEGLIDYTQIYTGGSLDCAQLINDNQHSICINWAGGLHHAKKEEAGGFCYVNDIVICILELLRFHPRVLYVDIDVHHGDGVEEAFFCTNRVMTVSFHQYGNDFFPGTGHHDSIGYGEGKGYALNVPLYPGITDEMYVGLFKDVMTQVIDKFRPDAIVMCCGSDSINEDLLGSFNMSTHGHAACVDFILSQGIPTVLLGGGGYTIENVARCWTNETAVALGKKDLDEKLPPNEYSNDFSHNDLHVKPNPSMVNRNTKEYIDKLKISIFERLQLIEGAPSVQFHDIPESLRFKMDDIDEEQAAEKIDEEEAYDASNKEQGLISKPSDFMM